MTGGRLRRPAACSTPSLVPYTLIILANLHFAAAGDGESDSEFAFNVFTDLAPLLALFGEQFARQFMSESLTWLDHIIFAMAPLGIVTAIVGAIRVSGPAWARAFIGRARESRAAAEIELMSSTSREVCEVYNGKGVVRAMGTPKLTQFILFPAQYRNRDDTCGIHTLKTAYERSQPYLEKGKYGVKTDWSTSKKQEDWQLGTAFGAGLAMGVALIDPTLGITGVRRRLWGNGKSKPADVENPRALELYVDRPKAPSFPLELEGSAPNLQLNLPSSISSHKSTIKDLWCAALFAILVQEAVLVISAVTTFHPATRRAIGPPQTDYGFWMFIAGTICLNLGMILCSFVIEQSTREWSWRKAASQEEQLPGTTKEANLARRHPDPSASLQLFWLQQKHTVNDQDFEPFLILGGPKDEILTSSRDLDYDSWSPVWGKPIPKWIEKIVANKYEFVTIWASLFGLIGFMLQFEGLRGLTWPTAVSQLLAIFVVALIRAIVRRRLGKSPSAVRAHGGHELDCTSKSLRGKL
ncbi:hypothetical protein EJ04DRAFT_592429 [Polyplosphaeria fusca]|uniref:Uncharacterized protein n=1 Tax=Polyplosphaeria fusca TaxID=682080 RepID=A0A9P4QMF1_9PLEO|nr:hypothetical protein EJ04DRAFT_592429 [Polyplosphaeria fusca]